MIKYSFLEELLILDTIHGHCNGIDLPEVSLRLDFPPSKAKDLPHDRARSYWDVPDYMKVSFHGEGKPHWEKNVAIYEGSYIDLGLYRDLDHFLKSKLSSGRISKIKAYRRNLERIFPIRYAQYYGEISETTYSLLMDALKGMITHRFAEKKMDHMALEDWDGFQERGRKLIMDKRAAMIVIYSGERPIHISFNYVWEELVFGFVRGYDLDYSKFYLGFIDIVIQMEWCFDQGFRIYDLLRGNLDYKLLFADRTYLYRIHFLLPPGPLHKKLRPLAHWLAAVLKFDLYYPVLGWLKGVYHKLNFLPKRRRKHGPLYHFEDPSQEEQQHILANAWEQRTLDEDGHKYLKRAAYHFLYTAKTGLSELQIFQAPERADTYFFKGGGKIAKVRFKG